MANQLELLEAQALQLSSGERAAFAQVLLASLDEDAEIDAAWASESERRSVALDRGVTRGIPIADALARLRARLA
jgi:Putative addiction module component